MLVASSYGRCANPRSNSIITGRNEVVAKVIFLHLSVIPFTEGCLPQCMLGYHTSPEQTPPPLGSRLRHAVDEQPVCILLECILVFMEFSAKIWPKNRLVPPRMGPPSPKFWIHHWGLFISYFSWAIIIAQNYVVVSE